MGKANTRKDPGGKPAVNGSASDGATFKQWIQDDLAWKEAESTARTNVSDGGKGVSN